ncbi:MAG: CcmD family protein [Vicinamibacteria bacterium]
MKNLGYLFAAYTVIWLVLFAYIMSIASRQKKLDMELETLRKLVERKK